jgi:very-short-patch-repair endonuclease
MIRWAVRTGRVARLAHGVYICAETAPEEATQQHLMTALAHQLNNRMLIASHHTAAHAWGLAVDGPLRIPSFIAPQGTGIRAGGDSRFHVHVRHLPAHHRTAHPSGLNVTTAARAAVDVAAGCTLPEALVTLDSAARTDLLAGVGERGLRRAYADDHLLADTRATLLEAAHWAATQRSRGWLEEVVPMADPRRESPAESLSFGHMVLSGLPLPLMQVRILTPDGEFHPDFLWPDHGLIGEVDGRLKYRHAEDLVAEKRRQESLERMGYHFVRWMGEEITSRPASVTARVASALERLT